jgi:hypothetical protein
MLSGTRGSAKPILVESKDRSTINSTMPLQGVLSTLSARFAFELHRENT